MKRLISIVLILILVLSISLPVLGASENVAVGLRTFNVNNLSKRVNVVTIDLNSPDIKLDVVTANDKVQGSEDFQSMINRKKPIAAINANFFDAYLTLEPYGSIMKNNKFTYLEGKNPSFMIKEGNKVDIEYFSTRIEGYLDGQKANKWNNTTQAMDFYLFNIWYVNNLPTDSSGVYMYTPDRGDNILLNGGTVIEVIENKITKVVKNPQLTVIPKNGYLIYYAKDIAEDNYINNRFKKGRTVELKYTTTLNTEKKEEDTNTPAPVVSAKQTKLFGSIDKKTKNNWNAQKDKMDFNIFNIWYINTRPIDSSGVYLYTPERGDTFQVPEGKAVTVKNKIITKVELKAESIIIPKDGFVIYFGKDSVDDNYINNRFILNKSVDFYHENNLKIDTDNIIKKAVADNSAALAEDIKQSGNTMTGLDLNTVDHMISSGPFLVKDGKVVVDNYKQSYEDKIKLDRAQRSALGITKDNKLILVTGSNLNVNELAIIMLNLGCEKAMNLDGGASSGLYAKGKMITTPGRKLNTVLMIYDIKE